MHWCNSEISFHFVAVIKHSKSNLGEGGFYTSRLEHIIERSKDGDSRQEPEVETVQKHCLLCDFLAHSQA